MKKNSPYGLLILLVAALFGGMKAHGQIEEMGKFMAAGPEDAQTLIQPYITPAVNAFGSALSGGWYNTAETHKLGGFDITFTASTAIIPKKYETFLVDDAELTGLRLEDPQFNESPTVAGDNESGPMMNYVIEEGGYTYEDNAFEMPGGLNTNYVPSPMIQAGIGLIKGTEVIVRFIPNLKYEGNELGLWGIGGKHDIGQWIPAIKKVPVLKLAVMYGYTKLHTYVNISITPEDINAEGLTGADQSNWDNQEMNIITQSHTANLLVSANLPVVCFYGGFGFVTTKTNLTLKGDYPSVGIDESLNPVVVNWTDPIDMEIKNQDGGLTKPRINAGVRFKFSIVTLHFDYSWANYSVMTAGLGFSFR